MVIEPALIEALALEFVRKRGTGYIIGTLLPGDNATRLGDATHKYSEIHVSTIHADTALVNGSSNDTVDGLHASTTPIEGYLYPLGPGAIFPTSVYPQAVLRTGSVMTGNLDMAPGALVDGVDINLFKAAYDLHVSQGANGSITVHNHLTDAQGGDLLQFAHTDGYGTRSAYMAERLNKLLIAGRGLSGGGRLDQNQRLEVNAGDGLSFSISGAVQLATPGSVSAQSSNTSVGNHTHAVSASSDTQGEALLKTNTSGALRVQGFAVGVASIPGGGNIAASGDVRGNRILSDGNTFVGNDLTVGTNVLVTAKTTAQVFVNKQAGGAVQTGALTVRPGTAQTRGVVIQGLANQESTAPLLAVADSTGADVFLVRPNGSIESGSPAYVSGLKGWQITGEGDAEFRNITARGELHTSVFVANEMHATGGTMAVMTTGIIENPINTSDNIVGSTFNLVVAGDPNLPGVCVFKLDDVLRIKLLTGLQEN